MEGGERALRESRTNGRSGVFGDILQGSVAVGTTTAGRWPANVVHDGSPEVEAAFAAFGERTSGEMHPWHDAKASPNGSMSGGNQAGRVKQSFGGGTGSASRFFYSAKATAADRADKPGIRRLPSRS